jgi:hypothetical protein
MSRQLRTIIHLSAPVISHQAEAAHCLGNVITGHQKEIEASRLKCVGCGVAGMAAFAWGIEAILRERIAADHEIKKHACRELSLPEADTAEAFLGAHPGGSDCSHRRVVARNGRLRARIHLGQNTQSCRDLL